MLQVDDLIHCAVSGLICALQNGRAMQCLSLGPAAGQVHIAMQDKQFRVASESLPWSGHVLFSDTHEKDCLFDSVVSIMLVGTAMGTRQRCNIRWDISLHYCIN